MTRLAVASLRYRLASLTACALSVLLGTTILLAFGAMYDTGTGAGVSEGDEDALVTMASVVGSWGLVIVLFSVASTLGLTVRQRATELAALRTIGMTNRQVRKLVRRETFGVAVVAAVAAIPFGWAAGRALVGMLHAGDVVDDSVGYRFGPVTSSALIVGVLVVSLGAATLASRHATRGTPRAALVRTEGESERLGRKRVIGAVVLILLGLNMATLTLTVAADSDDPFIAMQFSGPASIYTSLGLALLGPLWLRIAGRLLGPVLTRFGAAGHLAASHVRRRSVRLSAALMPIVLFVGIANATFYLMAVHEQTATAAAEAEDPNGVVVLLNYVVVGMMAAFAAIMVINTIVSTLADRRRELARQRLLGATDSDVVGEVVVEGTVLLGTGLVVGLLASLVTIIPFTVVKTDGWLPDTRPLILPAVIVAAALVTVGTSTLAARRLVRRPALESAVAA